MVEQYTILRYNT